ncbi:MAG TPA: ferritin-like domain-containing protein [Candidatus Limnocylindria bacterium]|nr:ferritin-like domain-containing protein [Candidatus Limnocylindria bacterium]
MGQSDDFFSAVAALNALERLDVDGMRLLYRVERAGEQFYSQLADRIGDPRAAELLRRNGREERGHAERIRRAIGIKLGAPYEPTAADQAPYAIALPDAVTSEMLAVIVQAERDGDAGYEGWAQRETDAEVQRLLRLNGREETVHGERVAEVMAILAAASSG